MTPFLWFDDNAEARAGVAIGLVGVGIGGSTRTLERALSAPVTAGHKSPFFELLGRRAN
ncbi:MAG TPA: hypothetical protein VMU68_01625 [Acidimicrobiales bacterium]|nr:hypothetical protein [Acidimicrobiales bacterium]